MGEFLKILFGDFTLIELFGYLWFFIIGYLIYGLTEVSGRNVNSPNTPKKFSWKFWFYDNWRRYLITILNTYVFFRFYVEISGHTFSNIDALMLGLIGDGVAAKMKEKVKFLGTAYRSQLTAQIKKEQGEIE